MHLTFNGKTLLLAAALAGAVLTLSRGYAQGGGQGPRSQAAPAGPQWEVTQFAGVPGRWAWLRTKGGETELHTSTPGGAPALVARGRGWVELALEGDTAWLLTREGKKGALLRVSLAPGSEAATERAGLAFPAGLWAGGGRVYWTEMPTPAAPGLDFVPPAGPVARVFLRESSGQVRPVAEWPVGAAPAVDPDRKVLEPRARVLGLLGPDLCLQVHRLRSTEWVRVPLSGGAPVRLAAESGVRQGVLRDGTLYWTAPSAEATPTSRQVCLRSLRGGSARMEAEWLDSGGYPLVARGDLFYVSYTLYRIPGGGGVAVPLQRILGVLKSDGESLVHIPLAGNPALLSPGAR